MIRRASRITAIMLASAAFVIAGPVFLGGKKVKPIDPVTPNKISKKESAKLETVDLGAGCFWCIEAVLERIKGVQSVESGYMGGIIQNPTYKQICTGTTGHAEIVRVKFDPKALPFPKVPSMYVIWSVKSARMPCDKITFVQSRGSATGSTASGEAYVATKSPHHPTDFIRHLDTRASTSNFDWSILGWMDSRYSR